MDKFKINVNPVNLAINDLTFSPGEASSISKIVGMAGRMGQMKVLPPHIANPPFKVSFSEDGSCKLSRKDSEAEVSFRFEEADALVDAVNNAVAKSTDETTLRPQPRATGGFSEPHGDIIEGSG